MSKSKNFVSSSFIRWIESNTIEQMLQQTWRLHRKYICLDVEEDTIIAATTFVILHNADRKNERGVASSRI